MSGAMLEHGGVPSRTRISPSDLTFLWSSCRRCFWLKYRLGHEIPSVFPGIVNALSAKQEAWYRDKTLAEFSPRLPSGQIFRFNKRVTSLPLLLDGRITPFVLSGKYDFLLRYDDGSFGIIDTKLSSSLGKAALYWPQLAAYRHILEFPNDDESRVCRTLGLLIWTPSDVRKGPDGSLAIGFNAVYEEVVPPEGAFDEFLYEVLNCISSREAPPLNDCETCQAVEGYPLSRNS